VSQRTRAIVRDAAKHTDARIRLVEAAHRDVELLSLARLAGFRIRGVGITCHCRQDSRVRVRAGIASVLDVLRIRVKGRPPLFQAGFTFSARGPFGP
jgi:hypothetical protein